MRAREPGQLSLLTSSESRERLGVPGRLWLRGVADDVVRSCADESQLEKRSIDNPTMGTSSRGRPDANSMLRCDSARQAMDDMHFLPPRVGGLAISYPAPLRRAWLASRWPGVRMIGSRPPAFAWLQSLVAHSSLSVQERARLRLGGARSGRDRPNALEMPSGSGDAAGRGRCPVLVAGRSAGASGEVASGCEGEAVSRTAINGGCERLSMAVTAQARGWLAAISSRRPRPLHPGSCRRGGGGAVSLPSWRC